MTHAEHSKHALQSKPKAKTNAPDPMKEKDAQL